MASCARATCDSNQHVQLGREAARVKDWGTVVGQAAAHGMGPLLYTHLKAAQVQLPQTVHRGLQGLYARHRAANRIRTRLLCDVLDALESVGIRVLVLKGAALAHLVYPEPGLRPMSDIDLLVPRPDVRQAQGVLIRLGFDAHPRHGSLLRHRHLSPATLQVEGLLVQVELHHRLFSDYFDSAMAYLRSRLPRIWTEGENFDAARIEGLMASPQPFDLEGTAAYTLRHEDMLWHLCQHLCSHVNVWDYGRLIWVADIVSYAERFAEEIDWKHIQQRYPGVLNTLSVLHFMTPLSDDLFNRAPIEVSRAPEGIGIGYRGWPRVRATDWRERGYTQVLHDTLLPSEWWLRLRYQLGARRSIFWYRWMRHPIHILGQTARALLEWMGWPTASDLAGLTREKEQYV